MIPLAGPRFGQPNSIVFRKLRDHHCTVRLSPRLVSERTPRSAWAKQLSLREAVLLPFLLALIGQQRWLITTLLALLFTQRAHAINDLLYFDPGVAAGGLGVLVTQRFLDQGDVAGQFQ
jgi:hypothetical protein